MTGLFTVGNLIILLIVGLGFVLVRIFDKRDNYIRLAKKQGEKLKEELRTEMENCVNEKAKKIYDDSVIVEANERKSKILIDKVQEKIDNLSHQQSTIDQIDERIALYKGALESLDDMTNRVDINLKRIADESEYVENAAEKISGIKNKIDEIEKNIEAFQNRIESQTEEKIKSSADAILGEVRTNVNNLITTSSKIEEKVEACKDTINTAQNNLADKIAADMEMINGMIARAANSAETQASDLEESLLSTLRKDAADRSRRAQEEIINKINDEINNLQKDTQSKIYSTENLINTESEKWATSVNTINTQQKEHTEKWQRESEGINNILDTLKEKSESLQNNIETRIEKLESMVKTELKDIETQIEAYKAKEESTITEIVDKLALVAEETQKRSLEEADAKLEEYRSAQTKQFDNLERMANDTLALDAELRKHLQNVTEASTMEFNESMEGIKTEIHKLGYDISSLKKQAYEKISENLKKFESEFNGDLTKRSILLDNEFTRWRTEIDNKFSAVSDDLDLETKKLEKKIEDSLFQKKSELDVCCSNEVEKVKTAAVDMEKNAKAYIDRAEDSVKELQNKVQNAMQEMRQNAENSFKEKAAQLALQNIEKLKDYEKVMETAYEQTAQETKLKYEEISTSIDKSRNEVHEYKAGMEGVIKELSDSITSLGNVSKENYKINEQQIALLAAKIEDFNKEVSVHKTQLIEQTEEKIKSLSLSIQDADEKIENFMEKTKLIEKTEILKENLSKQIEDLNTEIEKLNLRRTELVGIESQITKIKRTEDEVNEKMAKFLMEQTRIERMEADFKKLLQTSQSVEEKLSQVSASDDKLQEMQVNLRKINDAIAETEERYQRIEKKNQTLDVTNDGIDRNFKQLQESENAAHKLKDDLVRITVGFDDIRAGIEKLASENEKTNAAVEKINSLEKTLDGIDAQIKKIDQIRTWYSQLEGRMDETQKNILNQTKLVTTMLEPVKNKSPYEDPIPRQMHDQVITLRNQGWSEKDISKSLKIPVSSVQLILEQAGKS
ncbi:MAG: hypothetical protein Ta2F_01590 [Termitinemataceae bacterium]|nr:MAG: hypothetical protein Ta2F_01590 [Termitinemataceae bacterium]